MTCVCLLVGLIGGLGVAAGSALGRMVARGRLLPLMLGGALGGMVVGSLGRLIGLDAFSLLIGSRPLAITGGSEGLIIGAMAGAGSVARRARAPDARGHDRQGRAAGCAGRAAGDSRRRQDDGGKSRRPRRRAPDAPLGRCSASLTPPLLLMAGAVEGAIFIAALTLAFSLTLRSRGAD